MSKHESGVIKRILKEHFDGFWKMNEGRFPETYRDDIKETVEKAIRCGTRDLGYSRYECLGCEGNTRPVFVCFTCKSRFCHKCGKKYTDDWSEKQQEMILDVPHRHMVFDYGFLYHYMEDMESIKRMRRYNSGQKQRAG